MRRPLAKHCTKIMDQGLMLIDKDGKVVICNRRARELLDLPAEFVSRQPSFQEILQYQWHVNWSRSGADTFESFYAQRVLDRAHSVELRQPNGLVVECRNSPLAEGGTVRTYTDITERKIAEERTRYFARHDNVTRLANRAAFNERLEDAIKAAEADRRGMALFYLDLDRFKDVNDTHGHAAGDRLLTEVGKRIKSIVRSVDTVARLGGGEFAIILPFLEGAESAANLAARVVDAVGKPFDLDRIVCNVGASVGVALFPENGTTAGMLTRAADRALYDAKRAGRSTFRLYTATLARSMPPTGAAAGRVA